MGPEPENPRWGEEKVFFLPLPAQLDSGGGSSHSLGRALSFPCVYVMRVHVSVYLTALPLTKSKLGHGLC